MGGGKRTILGWLIVAWIITFTIASFNILKTFEHDRAIAILEGKDR